MERATRSSILSWLTAALLVVLGLLLGYLTGFLSALTLLGIPIVTVSVLGWLLWRWLASRDRGKPGSG